MAISTNQMRYNFFLPLTSTGLTRAFAGFLSG